MKDKVADLMHFGPLMTASIPKSAVQVDIETFTAIVESEQTMSRRYWSGTFVYTSRFGRSAYYDTRNRKFFIEKGYSETIKLEVKR